MAVPTVGAPGTWGGEVQVPLHAGPLLRPSLRLPGLTMLRTSGGIIIGMLSPIGGASYIFLDDVCIG
eukprot:1939399-Heterocapsa_arctica.AAC.1